MCLPIAFYCKKDVRDNVHGAETAAPLLKILLPDAKFEFRGACQLTYAGQKNWPFAAA